MAHTNLCWMLVPKSWHNGLALDWSIDNNEQRNIWALTNFT